MTPWRTVAGADGRRWWRLAADSTADVLAAGAAPSVANRGAARSLDAEEATADRADGPTWYGLPTAADVRATLCGARPWAAGLDAAARLAAGLAVPRVASVRRRRAWGPEGDLLDSDRALAGVWDQAWTRTVREAVAGGTRTVDIYLDAAANCTVGAAEYAWTGVVACALADVLEGAGYSAGITAVSATTGTARANADGRPTDALVSCAVKAPGEPLDTARVVAWTGLAGAFRVAVFRVLTSCPAALTASFGRPTPARAAWESVHGAADPGTLWIPALRSAADASEWIAATVADLDPAAREQRAAAEAEQIRAERAEWLAYAAAHRAEWAREAAVDEARLAAERAAETPAQRRAREAADRRAEREWERERRARDRADAAEARKGVRT